MITISVSNTGKFPVSAQTVKEVVKNVFLENGIKSNAEASVAIVGEAKMLEFAIEHLGESVAEAHEHPVLSFPTSEIEGKFVFPPDKIIHLGEIVVSYPKAVEEAKKTNKLVEDVVCDLAAHGALHLIGIHHK